jgi:hypothetical protein
MLTLSEFGDIIFNPWHSIIRFFQFKVNRKPLRAVCAVTLSRFTGEKGADISSQNIYLGDSQTRHLKILGAEYRKNASEPTF